MFLNDALYLSKHCSAGIILLYSGKMYSILFYSRKVHSIFPKPQSVSIPFQKGALSKALECGHSIAERCTPSFRNLGVFSNIQLLLEGSSARKLLRKNVLLNVGVLVLFSILFSRDTHLTILTSQYWFTGGIIESVESTLNLCSPDIEFHISLLDPLKVPI